MAKLDKRRLREVRYTDKRRLQGAVFFPGPQPYIWYVEVLGKIAPGRKYPWGTTKEIGLFTTPSHLKSGKKYIQQENQ